MFHEYFSCFMNTLIKQWLLHMCRDDIWDCQKVVVGCIRQVVILCSVNTTKYYLGRLVSGHYGEVVISQGWSLRQVRLYTPTFQNSNGSILQLPAQDVTQRNKNCAYVCCFGVYVCCFALTFSSNSLSPKILAKIYAFSVIAVFINNFPLQPEHYGI